ncbi:MAG: hypothetical protein HGA85_01090 [Nanoarchaeota archaeon]|nr:hypothetical protein [Nanoarchaeota archaeon]
MAFELFGLKLEKAKKEDNAAAVPEKTPEEELLGKDPIAGALCKYKFVTVTRNKKKELEAKGQEEFEKYQHRFVKTEFPEPKRRFRLVLEYPNFNIEQTYYWFLRFYQETWGFEKVHKVIDTMSQSAASSMFGNMQSRLGAQQAQASQYLKGVSEMVKGLFQIVREVRVLDERLHYYWDSDKDVVLDDNGKPKKDKEGNIVYKGHPSNAESAEFVLKGLWIDQVEGGAKNPGSVYGLANTIGFAILPDLFFRIKLDKMENIETEVDKLKFNPKVREVLKRKLKQYYQWKAMTKRELEQRKSFEIKYLRQHYDTIRLYMSWVKPYLRNVRRLRVYEKNMGDPNLINSFETQIIELESLFVRKDFGHASAVLSVHFFYRVKPELSFHSYEYQNKGPIYSGMADITIRAYAWSDEQIKNYIAYRQEDDLDLLCSVGDALKSDKKEYDSAQQISDSIQQAMDTLGDDLRKYLREAGEKFPEDPKKKEEKPKTENILTPFVSVFEGFKELGKGIVGSAGGGEQKKKAEKPKRSDEIAHHRAEHFAVEACWEGYYRYKMGPGGNLYWVE